MREMQVHGKGGVEFGIGEASKIVDHVKGTGLDKGSGTVDVGGEKYDLTWDNDGKGRMDIDVEKAKA